MVLSGLKLFELLIIHLCIRYIISVSPKRQSMSSAIGAASVAAMAAAPARAATMAATSRTAINTAGNFVHSKIEARRQRDLSRISHRIEEQ